MTKLLSILLLSSGLLLADDTNVIYRSDVSLMRVDAQVVDRDNRAITGLRLEDFVLRENGKTQQIRNFAREEMPLDVLFLLDVSASMRPHVQRIADAAHQALTVLGEDDRVAIVVFDRMARVRMPFRKGRSNVERELDSLLRQEGFHGGTDITRGMLFAAGYIAKEGRRDARRAIVILTDDETQRERDDAGVLNALERADAVMSALIAPDAMGTHGGMGRGGNGGGTWPGGGPSIGGGPLGGIILGRRGGYPGGPGGGMGGATHSAGTSEIARRSGGDSMPVNDASALEDTLARLRQRYALHFYLPAEVRPGQERNIEVQLSSAGLRRYPDAEVRFRRRYIVPDGAGSPSPSVNAGTTANSDPVVVTRASSDASADAATPMAAGSGGVKRRRAVNEDGSSVEGSPVATTPAAAAPASQVVDAPPPAEAQQPAPKPQQRGWRRVNDTSGSSSPNLEPQAPKDSSPKP